MNATIAQTEELMDKTNKVYEYKIYEGAGHAFMRRGDDPKETSEANKKARDEAWQWFKELLD